MALSRLVAIITLIIVSAPCFMHSSVSANDFASVGSQNAALAALLAKPQDAELYNNYVATLPRRDLVEGDNVIKRYAVEGDLVLGDDDLRAYVEGLTWKKGIGAQPELKVLNFDQKDQYWKKRSARKLTYAIARPQFSDEAQYNALIVDMELAAKMWMEACTNCEIQFTHLRDYDLNADFGTLLNKNKISFLVRPGNTGANIAEAFFPHFSKKSRVIVLGARFFVQNAQTNRVGILAHELGHALGYRHEHIKEAAGCATDEDDGNWRRLSDYDSYSIMNYICDGTEAVRTALSSDDVKSHTSLYLPLNEMD